MSRRMFTVLIGIVALMFYVVFSQVTGLSILDSYLTNLGFNVSVIIDATPPDVVIIHPNESTNYTSTSILLNYTITDSLSPINTIWYNLNGGSNITVTAPTIITIPNGSNILYVYANDTVGNLNMSQINVTVNVVIPPEDPPEDPGGGGSGGGFGTRTEEDNVTSPDEIPPEVAPPVELPVEPGDITDEVITPTQLAYAMYGSWFLAGLLLLFTLAGLVIFMKPCKIWLAKRKKDKKPKKKRKWWMFFVAKRRKKEK